MCEYNVQYGVFESTVVYTCTITVRVTLYYMVRYKYSTHSVYIDIVLL